METIRIRLPWKDTVIAPIGDLQWNGDRNEIALDLLKKHIDRALGMNAYFLGMGDYIDFMSPSNRARLQSADLYDGPLKTMDDAAMRLVTDVATILKPTSGRWLGLLEGHHFYQLSSGITTDMKLAEMLGTRHLGTCASLTLSFENRGTVILWAHHGMGSGKAHAPIMKLENLAPYWQADIFLIGHMTKVASAPLNRCYPVFPAKSDIGYQKHRKYYVTGTGGWSKGYMDQSRQGQVPRGGYVERKMLNPVCLGAPLVRLVPQRSGAGERRYSVEITVEV